MAFQFVDAGCFIKLLATHHELWT